MFNVIGRRRKLFLILCAVFTLSLAVSCGGSGGGGDSGGGDTPQTPLTGGLIPEDVVVVATGDYSGCIDLGDGCSQLSACLSTCYESFMQQYSQLDPSDEDYATSIEDLNTALNTCTGNCYTQYPDCELGSTFIISLTFTNTTTETRTIILPAGLYFVPENGLYQQMMIIEEIVIELQSSETKTVCLPVFCIDSDLEAPDGNANYTSYVTVEPTDSGCLADIVGALENVAIDEMTNLELNDLQDVIWTCRETGEIGDAGWAFLNGLPTITATSFSATGVTEATIPESDGTEITRLKKRTGIWKSQFGN